MKRGVFRSLCRIGPAPRLPRFQAHAFLTPKLETHVAPARRRPQNRKFRIQSRIKGGFLLLLGLIFALKNKFLLRNLQKSVLCFQWPPGFARIKITSFLLFPSHSPSKGHPEFSSPTCHRRALSPDHHNSRLS